MVFPHRAGRGMNPPLGLLLFLLLSRIALTRRGARAPPPQNWSYQQAYRYTKHRLSLPYCSKTPLFGVFMCTIVQGFGIVPGRLVALAMAPLVLALASQRQLAHRKAALVRLMVAVAVSRNQASAAMVAALANQVLVASGLQEPASQPVLALTG